MSLLVLWAGVAAATAAAALWLSGQANILHQTIIRRAHTLTIGRAPGGGGAGQGVRLPLPGPGEVRRDEPEDASLLLDLLGSMLQAGLPVSRALEVVAPAAGPSARTLVRVAAALRLGVAWESAWPSLDRGTALAELKDSLHFAVGTGAPSAELLFARARQLRRARHRELERRAAALGVRLVVPLGVCSLPAFLCLGVIPVLLAMLPAA